MTPSADPTLVVAGLAVPTRLDTAIRFLRGDAEGRQWLAALDGILHMYQARWSLRLHGIAEGGAMSCCTYCTDDEGAELVLKIPVDSDLGLREAATLQAWADSGVVPRVHRIDPVTGVFLMERIRPGDSYTGITSIDDINAFLATYRRLADAGARARTPARSLAEVIQDRLEWGRTRFDDPEYAQHRPDLDRASHLARYLLETGPQHLVHGDLQAKNLIWGSAGALRVIDPLCASGDPGSDVAMWAVLQDSPVPISDVLTRLTQELGLDETRLRNWAYVIASAELRPAQPSRFERQSAYLRLCDLRGGLET